MEHEGPRHIVHRTVDTAVRVSDSIEMYTMIGETLTTADIERYRKGAQQFETYQENTQEAALKSFANDTNSDDPELADLLHMIYLYTDPVAKRAILQKGLKSDDCQYRCIALSHVDAFPIHEREEIILNGFEDTNLFVREAAVAQVGCLPIEHRRAFIKKALSDPASPVQSAAINQLETLEERERLDIFSIGMSSKDPYVRRDTLEQVSLLPDDNMRVVIIEFACEDSDETVRTAALDHVGTLPIEKRKHIIEQGLQSKNENVRAHAVAQVGTLNRDEWLQIVERGLTDRTKFVRNTAKRMLKTLSADECDVLVSKKLIDTKTLESRDDRDELRKFVDSSDLYGKDTAPFIKKAFTKTGSEITLIDQVPFLDGVSLKERVIVRKINVLATKVWQTAYQAVDAWQVSGFDYIPIEPIVKLSPPKDESVYIDVYARVVPGPNAQDWKNKTELFAEQIQEQVQTILATLTSLDIEHGHPHLRNFVLHFYRDINGNVDLSQVPRVYLIDFDMAHFIDRSE